MVFRSTPIGTRKLKEWLGSRWEKLAKERNHEIDLAQFQKEMNKMEYEDLELLYRMTLLDPLGREGEIETNFQLRKRFDRLLGKIARRNMLEQLTGQRAL